VRNLQNKEEPQTARIQRVPNRINPRGNTPRHILIKVTKIKHKEQILKEAREHQKITHKGIPIRITVDLSIGVSGVLKSPTITVLLIISPFILVSICLTYCGAPMLGASCLELSVFLGLGWLFLAPI